MMTFKEFLREEDEETDREHDNVDVAAAEYVAHCSKFADIERPLFRLSRVSGLLRTRVPRERKRRSLGGSGDEQEYVFSLPAWSGYPERRMSIFCSTTTEFDVGEPNDNNSNLFCIYPYDGVKIAVLDDKDLNNMNILKGSKSGANANLADLFAFVHHAFEFFEGTDFYNDLPGFMPVETKLEYIKKVFNRRGKFDSEANGNDELADKFAEAESDGMYLAKQIRACAVDIPERLTPEAWGAKLVTSAGLDLPGKARECWFSGKYLSVPYNHHREFVAAVKQLKKAD